MSFAEIADMSGFNDYSNFVRAFKNVMGITPTEYRQRAQMGWQKAERATARHGALNG